MPGGTPSSPPLTAAELDQLYERIRRYVEHEDNVFNQRMSWFITINSFLFATVGLVFQAMPQALTVSDRTQASLLLLGMAAIISIVALTAILVCLFTARVLDHARHSMKRLCEIWEYNTAGMAVAVLRARWPTRFFGFAMRDKQPVAGVYPFVMGAGFVPFRRGILRSGRVAYIFLGAWVLVAMVLLFVLKKMGLVVPQLT